MSLTHGAVASMVRGGGGNHTVQIINLKTVGPQGDRFRVSQTVKPGLHSPALAVSVMAM